MRSDVPGPPLNLPETYRDRIKGIKAERAIATSLQAFGLPRPTATRLVTVGYEDLNVVLDFDTGSKFLKIFRTDRTAAESERYVSIATALIAAGVRHPRLMEPQEGYRSRDGLPLAICNVDGVELRACCMDFVPGVTLDLLEQSLSSSQALDLARQVALIHSLPPTPNPSYDHWSVRNLASELSKAVDLNAGDRALVERAVDVYLPQIVASASTEVLIHADLVPTNIILGNDGLLYIVDLARADVGSPAQEWAVIVSQTLDPAIETPEALDLAQLAIDEYRRLKPESSAELDRSLGWYRVCVNAAYLVAANQIERDGYYSAENRYWLDRSRTALRRALDQVPA